MILITGVTGSVGGAVLAEAMSRGVAGVRAMVRNEKDLAKLPAGVQGVAADFSDPPSLAQALDGVESAYLVCAAVPELVELESNFLMACQKAKTPHVVLQSALGAADFGKSFPAWHRKVEDKAAALNVPVTILRPNGFMQNISAFFSETIRTSDRFFDALGSAKISYIDVRDIAAAAVAAIVQPTLRHKTYELHGPQALSHHELAARISGVAHRKVEYVPLTLEQMLQGMIAAGMPEARARPVVELYEYYLSGKGEGSDQALRSLIGREPRTIDGYLRESAAIFRKPATS